MDKKPQIPSSIASKLEQIKLYMRMRRVTAFVGAGFSMNAEIPQNVSMKTWPQLCEVFLDKLYPNNEEDNKNGSNDVVRLASMVDAMFGHNELDNILETALPDSLIRPGKLHRLLIRLPWKDILTTNYDTLIERAAAQEINDFKLVTNKETLLYQPSPRIIKLHGSFPNIRPYIMTQEDYRRYPLERPEMVNTARQCFLESLVCLIGFSGEDPNFRAWIGWLKDVIGQQRICPTYLITYTTEFHDAEKALLSKFGIDIINLSEIGGVNDYYSAYEFFFDYLKDKPKQWNGRVEFGRSKVNGLDDNEFNAVLEEKIKDMQNVRETYPGWLFIPEKYEKGFEELSMHVFFMGQYYKRITEDHLKLQFLYEINWRLTVSATPKQIDWFIEGIKHFSEQQNSIPDDCKKYMPDLLASLLEVLRYNGKDKEFLEYCDKLLGDDKLIPASRIYYQQALYWLSKYDDNKVKETLTKWAVDISDYQNCLQKANILIYIGEKLEAFKLLTDCKASICVSLRQNKDDIYAKSCLTHILSSINMCTRWSDDIQVDEEELDYARKFAIGENFAEYIERIARTAYEQKPVQGFVREHLFGIGEYKNSWNSGSPGFVPEYLYPCRLWMLKERIGVQMFQISQNLSKYCIRNLFQFKDSWNMAWGMMMTSASGKVEEDVFGRKQLSLLTEEKANEYFDEYIQLIENPIRRNSRWVNNKIFYVLPTVLARLCTKVSQDRVLRFVKVALGCNPLSVNDALNYAYDCLDNNNLKVIWELILEEKDIKTQHNMNGYSFPDRCVLNYTLSNKVKRRIIEGLRSEEKGEILQSMIFIQVIWPNSKSSEIDKDIVKAVRDMRNRMIAIPEATYTYAFIDMNEDEKKNVKNKLDKDVKEFCAASLHFDHSSEPLRKFNDKLNSLIIFQNHSSKEEKNVHLSKEQEKSILLHCYDMIEQNKECFGKDDSQTFLGGMRQFTKQIIETYQRLFIYASFDGWTVDELSKTEAQIDWLMSAKYKCLPMKVKISMINQHKNKDDIVSSIKSALFSKKEDIRDEGIAAFLVLEENGDDISGTLDYIFNILALADESAYKELLILFANLIVKGYNKNCFYQRVMKFLTEIHKHHEEYGLDICALSDLQYYANFVAGALSVQTNDVTTAAFADEECYFNDVVVGFREFNKQVQNYEIFS